MLSLPKKIITCFILGSFLVLALFSFAMMFHVPGDNMPDNCLLNTQEGVLCAQDTLAVAIYHISSYQSFFNTQVNYGVVSIMILFIVACAFALFVISSNISELYLRTNRFYDSPPDIIYNKRKITRWLSLFENSPSLLFGA